MRKLLPLLPLALAPLTISSPKAAPVEAALQSVCERSTDEAMHVLAALKGQFADSQIPAEMYLVASSSTRRAQRNVEEVEDRFVRQGADIMRMVHAVCLSANLNTPMTCKGERCTPVNVAPAEVAPFELSGFGLYTTVDQPFFMDGLCSVYGLQVDTRTQVPFDEGYSPETAGHIADMRKLAIRSAVEACLDFRKGTHTTCRPFTIGAGEALQCWESR